MKLKVSEKEVMRDIAGYLSLMESAGKVAWWTRINAGMLRLNYRGRERFIHLARQGTPDFVGFLKDGPFFGIEAKGTGGKVTDAQRATLDKIQAKGGLGILAYSVADVDDAFGNDN